MGHSCEGDSGRLNEFSLDTYFVVFLETGEA